MRVKRFLILIFAGAWSFLCQAETPRFVALEFFGVHDLLGLSFDSRLAPDSRWGYKVGLGYGLGYRSEGLKLSPVAGFMRPEDAKSVVSLPVNVYYLLGGSCHFFESGVGFVPYYGRFVSESGFMGFPNTRVFDAFNYYGFLRAAYRYEGSRLLLSVGLDLPFQTPGSRFKQFLGIAPKLSIGYRF